MPMVERQAPSDHGERESEHAPVDELAETLEVDVPDLGAIERALSCDVVRTYVVRSDSGRAAGLRAMLVEPWRGSGGSERRASRSRRSCSSRARRGTKALRSTSTRSAVRRAPVRPGRLVRGRPRRRIASRTARRSRTRTPGAVSSVSRGRAGFVGPRVNAADASRRAIRSAWSIPLRARSAARVATRRIVRPVLRVASLPGAPASRSRARRRWTRMPALRFRTIARAAAVRASTARSR
jgi:hypothetical protein